MQHSPHNKKLLDQQNSIEEEQKIQEESSKNSKEESSETKFNQILFSFTPREVEETSSTTKTEKPREINETPKAENKEKTKIIKTINVISLKVNKQVLFDVIDKIQDEETQRNYLQNLKNLILTEN